MPRTNELTPREIEVLQGMVEGLANSDIGRRLYLSEDTIKTHAVRLYRKLHAPNRVCAVVEGLRRGLVRVPNLETVGRLNAQPVVTPQPKRCHPQGDPSIGEVTLRADHHDAALLASAWWGGLPVGAIPDQAHQRALDALRRLAGTATAVA